MAETPVQGTDAVEASAKLDAIVVDKAGTLTKGRPSVTDVLASGGLTGSEVLHLAAIASTPHERWTVSAVTRGGAAGESFEPLRRSRPGW